MRDRRRTRRRRWAMALVAALVVVAGAGGWLWLQWRSRGPEEASVNEAVDRFRGSVPTSVDDAPATLQPPAGVYVYEAQGSEHLSFMSTDQRQGPTVPATVTHRANGCWTFQIEYNTYHRQTWDWCARDGKLYESGGTTIQKFDFVAFSVDETSVFVCDPPFLVVDVAAGSDTVVSERCVGDSETTGTHVESAGTVRLVDREPVTVAGRKIPALHYRFDREISIDQTGTERVDTWFSAETGLPLRNEREIVVTSPAPAPIDDVTYTERGSWHLTSLTPKT